MADHENDEKGFNDDELKDIMEEIESLEKEFSDDAEGPGNKSGMSTPLVEKVDEKVDNILDNESSRPSVKPVRNNVSHLSRSVSREYSGQSKMSFQVAGQMSVELCFEVGGKVINFYVSEQDGVVIELEDGAKFSLPVSHKAA